MIGATIIGNIGQAPEYDEKGVTTRLTFSVASNRREKDRAGAWVDATTWVNVTVFGKRAQQLFQILQKGSSVYVSGKMSLREYKKRDGGAGASLDCIAWEVGFAGPKSSGARGHAQPLSDTNGDVGGDAGEGIPW